MRLLRASLASYRWARQLMGMDGIAAPPMFLAKSVAPGSPFVAFEVAALLLPTVAVLQVERPLVHLCAQVDDFCCDLRGCKEMEVAAYLGDTVEALAAEVEGNLGLPIAGCKTAVTASTKSLEGSLARRLHQLGTRADPRPARLGVRYCLRAGAANVRLQKKRWVKFTTKLGKLRTLAKVKKVGRKPGLMARAVVAGPLCGTEVVPLQPALLHTLRHSVGKLRRVLSIGASPGLAWALDDAGADPLGYHWWGPVERYCREWFTRDSTAKPSDALQPGILHKAIAGAVFAPRPGDHPRSRRQSGEHLLARVLEGLDVAG